MKKFNTLDNLKLPYAYNLILGKFTVKINDLDVGIKDNIFINPKEINHIEDLNQTVITRNLTKLLGLKNILYEHSKIILAHYLNDDIAILNIEYNILNNNCISAKINKIYNMVFEIKEIKLNWREKRTINHLYKLIKNLNKFMILMENISII